MLSLRLSKNSSSNYRVKKMSSSLMVKLAWRASESSISKAESSSKIPF